MGSLCSKSDTHSGGHTVLGAPATSNALPPAAEDRRVAAAEAAERRIKAAQSRGVQDSNPKKGQLAAKAGKLPQASQGAEQDNRLVWD